MSAFIYDECPYASHAFLTTHARHSQLFVSDFDKKWNLLTRDQGIGLSQRLRHRCDKTVFYVDRGWSSGMKAALAYCMVHKLPYEMRNINSELLSEKSQKTEGDGYPIEFINNVIDNMPYKRFMIDSEDPVLNRSKD